MRIKVFHLVFQASFYCILLTVFVMVYLKDEVRDFLEKRTTITTKFQEGEVVEFPTLTFCIHPGLKTSVARELKLKSFAEFFKNSLSQTKNNTIMDEQFSRLSYTLNKDFEITVVSKPLKLGITSIPLKKSVINFETQPIKTYFFGTCYKIAPLFEVRNVFSLFWTVKLSQSDEQKDKPKGVYLYLSSNETWQGIPLQTWPRYQLSKVYLPFENDFNKLFWRTINHSFLTGIDNTSQCLKIGLKLQKNHTKHCEFFSHGLDLPSCQSRKDLQEMRQLFKKQWFADCFKLMQATTYKIEHFEPPSFNEPDDSFLLVNIALSSMEQEIKEEIPIITSQSLIGSIGGSLGMFFGFSFTSIFIYFLNKALHK